MSEIVQMFLLAVSDTRPGNIEITAVDQAPLHSTSVANFNNGTLPLKDL